MRKGSVKITDPYGVIRMIYVLQNVEGKGLLKNWMQSGKLYTEQGGRRYLVLWRE